MNDDAVTHEQIEHAFKPAADLIARLPTEGMDGYAGKRAAEALRVAEDYVHQHREKLQPERTETVSGPAMATEPSGPNQVRISTGPNSWEWVNLPTPLRVYDVLPTIQEARDLARSFR